MFAIGVDVGGTHTKVARVAPGGKIARRTVIATGARGDPSAFLTQLLETLGELVADASPRGIGVALPGFLADDRRSIAFSPNTPALVGVDFVSLIERFGLPVFVEQDLNAPALAEYHFGAGRGTRRFMAAAIGTGLGASAIVDGEPLRFTGNTAGDNGHIILDPGGPACTAGCHGCAEAMIAAPAIERAVEGRFPARAVIEAARAGEPRAVDVLRGIGRWLGQWLASLTPIFMPERVALCGGVTEAGGALLDACIARFHELAGPDYTRCTITVSEFGGLAGAIGAATPFLLTSPQTPIPQPLPPEQGKGSRTPHSLQG